MKSRITIAILLAAVAIVVVAGLLIGPPATSSGMISVAPGKAGWFGTSPYGHDMGKLLLYSVARVMVESLWAGMLTIGLGVAIGMGASFAENSVFDRVQGFVAKLLDSVGVFILGICVMAALPRIDGWVLGALLALLGWPSVAGVVRADAIRISRLPYVEAARALGLGSTRVFISHQWPAIYRPLIPLFFSVVMAYVAVLASLSFLGAGASTQLTLGSLLYDSLSFLESAPWYFVDCVLALCGMLSIIGVGVFLTTEDGLRHS